MVETHLDDVGELVLPLDPYLNFGGPGHSTIEHAYQILFAECMARFGFDYKVPNGAGATDGPFRRANRYGLFDLDDARQYGYSKPPDLGKPVDTVRVPRSEAFAAVADGDVNEYGGVGVPDGGCVGESRRALDDGSVPGADPELGSRLEREAYALAEADSRVRDAFTAWSSCMSNAGHDYADPWEANDNPEFTSPGADAAEIAVAMADVSCKQEVHLVDIWAGVEAAYQLRLIDQNAEPLAEILAMMDARRRNAASIVAGAR